MSARPKATAQTLLLSAAAMALAVLPSHAGPCTTEIDRDCKPRWTRRSKRSPAAGPTAPESVAATLTHQPTPGSLAAAEEKLGEGHGMVEAVAALKRAREADNANDKSACEQALADVRRALGT